MTNTPFLTSRRLPGSWPGVLAALLIVACLASTTLFAYPPALPHTFYGMVRDELGNPLSPGATITLETTSGVKVYGVVSALFRPGVNYELRVPLDAGLTSDAYKPTALDPSVPFRIKVTIGSSVFLPIEMTHDFAVMGEPGQSTLLNLTLGVDNNGDGIPDAWQRRINSDINKVKPGDDADHDGLSNLQEYLAGTYANDSKSGFSLSIVRVENDAPILSFTAIIGRTYNLLGSTDFSSWAPIQFQVLPLTDDSPTLSAYTAADVRPVQVRAVIPNGGAVPLFFKLKLQ